MRIVIDLDGTICTLRKPEEDYADVLPIPGAIEQLQKLKKERHYIIIHSARHMKTCNGDIAEVEKRVGEKTRQWLEKYNIPYDELIFGKPYGHVYIDDLALPFRGWENIPSTIESEKINVVIPMAGLGSRFSKAGYTTIKPLIKVLDKQMVEWAVQSFSFLPISFQLIFIILQEHETQYNLSSTLKQYFGGSIKIIITPYLTRGQAETVFLAKDEIDNFNRLFIFNCDTYSLMPALWSHILHEEPDGTLVCFKATDPRYSYAAIGKNGYVTETAEKKVISNYASNGLYYFRHGYYFIDAFTKTQNQNTQNNSELYIAPLYNELIRLGKKVSISLTTENWVLGTPEEKDYFEKNYGK